MKVTAKAQRSGSWWAVEVLEVPGAFTQVRRLDQVPDMVSDAVALMTGVDPDSIDVTVVPHTDLDDLVAAARGAKADAEAAQVAASELVRKVARQLLAKDLTVRDAGQLLGVSPQRVSQLVNS